MIDFEALAAERAKTLSQPLEEWLKTTQQPYFETACASLSDGEILQLFSITDSPGALDSLAEAFAVASMAGEAMAFEKWKNALAVNNLSLEQAARLWQRVWPTEKNFLKCLDLIAAPSEMLNRKRR